MEIGDPESMSVSQLRALYRDLIGRAATGNWRKNKAVLRTKIAEAYRKQLLRSCCPHFTDKSVDVALKTEAAKGVEIKDSGMTVALATVLKNELLCICVREDLRSLRYGTFLLRKCCELVDGDVIWVQADTNFQKWYRNRGFDRAGGKAGENRVRMRADKCSLLAACEKLTEGRNGPRIEEFSCETSR